MYLLKFVSAAEFLISQNYTRSDSLISHGSSYTGGLLVSAAINMKVTKYEIDDSLSKF